MTEAASNMIKARIHTINNIVYQILFRDNNINILQQTNKILYSGTVSIDCGIALRDIT